MACTAFRTLEPVGPLSSAAFIKRHEKNPILGAKDIPFKSDLVFNCSVLKEDDRYVMVFRNDYFYDDEPEGIYPDDTNLGIAYSSNGLDWEIAEKPIFEYKTETISRIYDPRITVLEGRYYLTCCAQDDVVGPRATIFVSDDLKNFELVDMALPCSRNTLLFPEKINGKYYRMERPFWAIVDHYSNMEGEWLGQPFNTWISASKDLVHWGEAKQLLSVSQMDYANIKNGPGAPPIKTDRGWLLLVHGVDHDPKRGKNGWEDVWTHAYHAGVALLDLEDPTKVIGIGRAPLITPEAEYEVSGGFRNNVVFPMAGIVEDDGIVKIYYGAADTHICLAEAKLDDLLDMCEPV